MGADSVSTRRSFLCITGGLAAGIALTAIPRTAPAAGKVEGEGKEAGVNPMEDLMREHGVLRRVLLIYEELIRRINRTAQLPAGVIADAAGIVRRFIEDYHEKLEEDQIFPRFGKAGIHGDLIRVLLTQHEAGRRLTDQILKLSAPEELKSAQAQGDSSAAMRQIYGGTPVFKWKRDKKQGLATAMQEFVHMYRPHAAVEDTVLFPAFHSIITPGAFDELGEKFEDREKELFGKDGFEKMVESVERIEKSLGIDDLSKFTPKA